MRNKILVTMCVLIAGFFLVWGCAPDDDKDQTGKGRLTINITDKPAEARQGWRADRARTTFVLEPAIEQRGALPTRCSRQTGGSRLLNRPLDRIGKPGWSKAGRIPKLIVLPDLFALKMPLICDLSSASPTTPPLRPTVLLLEREPGVQAAGVLGTRLRRAGGLWPARRWRRERRQNSSPHNGRSAKWLTLP